MTAVARPAITGFARPSALEWLGFELAVGELLELRPRESRLLRILAEADGENITRIQCCCRMAWRGTGLEPMGEGSLKVYASRIRRALADIGHPDAMPYATRNATGYALDPDAVAALWSMIGARL